MIQRHVLLIRVIKRPQFYSVPSTSQELRNLIYSKLSHLTNRLYITVMLQVSLNIIGSYCDVSVRVSFNRPMCV